VRGFVGDENLPSNFLLNGFNAGRGFGGPRDMSGMESVEVLKGPRAALFGRGEPGGTVNLVTKRPTFERAARCACRPGSFDTYRADADWTAPAVRGVGLRLVGFYEDAGSFRDTMETRATAPAPRSPGGSSSHPRPPDLRAGVQPPGSPSTAAWWPSGASWAAIPASRFLGEPGDGPLGRRCWATSSSCSTTSTATGARCWA
jgi:iron complex outermembrane recepter protein